MGKISAITVVLTAAAALLAPFHHPRAESSVPVAATVAPLHSLVASVAEGVEPVELIVPAKTSPHGFILKPSHIRKMSGAKAVFYIGNDFEVFLSKALSSLPEEVRRVPVAEKSGIRLLKIRNGDRQAHDGHDHGQYDMHVWLSVKNAEKIVKSITRELSRMNPRGTGAYKKNARKLIKKLKKLDAKIRGELAGLEKVPYIVFHDAYVYFERDYGLNNAGSITVNPEYPPSAAGISRIRAKLRKAGAVCVFSEPQFGTKMVRTVTEGAEVKAGEIDPLGAGVEPGPDLYFEMMENMARVFKECLG